MVASKKKGRGRPGRLVKQIKNEDIKNYLSTDEDAD